NIHARRSCSATRTPGLRPTERTTRERCVSISNRQGRSNPLRNAISTDATGTTRRCAPRYRRSSDSRVRSLRQPHFVLHIRFRNVRSFALASLLLLALPAWGQGLLQAKEWKLSTALGPAYPQGKAGEVWARLINERSHGRLAVKHFPGAALVQRDPGREFVALRAGAIDLAIGSASSWASHVKELNLIALPWLFPDRNALERALNGDVGARLSSRIEAAGIVPLALVGNGFRELATKRPVHTP